MKIFTSTWIVGTYHIWTNADTARPNSGPTLKLYISIVYVSSDDSGKSTHLYILNWAFITVKPG